MAQQDEAQSIPVWLAESLRLTAFTRTPPPIGKQAWWEEATGREPQNSGLRREVAQQQDDGPLGPGRLVLVLQPSRIDWTLVPPTSSDPAPALFNLGSPGDALAAFVPVVRAWLGRADLPPLQRLAFGAVLLLPVQSRAEGYQSVMRLVPGLRLDTPDITDALFQVNRPRRSAAYTAASLKVNRLTKWSVAATHAFSIEVSGIAVQRALGPEQLSCRLELDINSDGTFDGVLDRAQLPLLLDEFVSLGLEIAKTGDHP